MKRGFTLIELLIVIAIIAILALIAIPNFIEAQTRAKVSRVQSDMRSLATGLESYFVDYNNYPIFQFGQTPNPQGYFRVYAGPIRSCAGLSTPVAYIDPGLPDFSDVFTQDMTDLWDRTFWLNNIQGAASYVTAKGYGTPHAWNAGALPTATVVAPMPMVFNGPEGRRRDAVWTLSSAGPDRQTIDPNLSTSPDAKIRYMLQNSRDWGYYTSGETCLYDPTNGTVSRGNIFRLSGGAN